MAYNHLIRECASVLEINQETGEEVVVIKAILCSIAAPEDFRYNVGGSAYDVQPLYAYIDKSEVRIQEGMRLKFAEGEDETFRIHSVSKWPRIKHEYIQLTLQGDGLG